MINALLHTIIIQTTQMAALAEFYRNALELDAPQVIHKDHIGFQFANVYFGFDLVEETPFEYPGRYRCGLRLMIWKPPSIAARSLGQR